MIADYQKVPLRRIWPTAQNAVNGTTKHASQSLTEFLNRTVKMTGFVVIALSLCKSTV